VFNIGRGLWHLGMWDGPGMWATLGFPIAGGSVAIFGVERGPC